LKGIEGVGAIYSHLPFGRDLEVEKLVLGYADGLVKSIEQIAKKYSQEPSLQVLAMKCFAHLFREVRRAGFIGIDCTDRDNFAAYVSRAFRPSGLKEFLLERANRSQEGNLPQSLQTLLDLMIDAEKVAGGFSVIDIYAVESSEDIGDSKTIILGEVEEASMYNAYKNWEMNLRQWAGADRKYPPERGIKSKSSYYSLNGRIVSSSNL
jgi:hypothetical protein